MTTVVVERSAGTDPPRTPRAIWPVPGLGDRIFRRGSAMSGLIVLLIMAAVGLFLASQAVQALKATGLSFLTTAAWEPDRGRFGIAAVLTGTVLIALVAVTLSFPLASCTALFISEVASPKAKQTLIAMVDLMAAVPSVVYLSLIHI